jgi:hypothetical protein
MTDIVYTQVITFFMIGAMLPAWVLVALLRPKPFTYIFRGQESAVCFAIALEFSRRLINIVTGAQIRFPGEGMAVFNILVLALIALLLWGRLSQVLRHRARNEQFKSDLRASLEARGVAIPEGEPKK